MSRSCDNLENFKQKKKTNFDNVSQKIKSTQLYLFDLPARRYTSFDYIIVTLSALLLIF